MPNMYLRGRKAEDKGGELLAELFSNLSICLGILSKEKNTIMTIIAFYKSKYIGITTKIELLEHIM